MQTNNRKSQTDREGSNGLAVKKGGRAMEAKMAGLVRDYGERAFQFAYRLSGNVDEAKDLVQEALFRVAKSWHRYDESRSLDAWFFTILRHAFLDSRRRYERRKSVSLEAPVGDEGTSLGDLIPEDCEDVLTAMERQESVRAVHEVLRGLSKSHRAVLKLRDLDGLRYEEVARELGVPCGTIRSRLSRAREAFRARSAQLGALAC